MGLPTRLLVANRGECALRIYRTLRKLDIEIVGIYEEDDMDSLHVKHADVAVQIQSYTSIEEIVRVCLEVGFAQECFVRFAPQ